ncbi:hypothetical protein N7452_011236 [Penicillium brevicompactum]|uniref:Uncharacterized protein n=1 Tax=Penicillium brevicompactum TaxID=5074 RepID=A0A9W9Q402_PENBR|nr:hypothetical protein N7452_011236 [Penicillium brevicompactum]
METAADRHRARRPVWEKALDTEKCQEYLPKLHHHTDLMASCIDKAGAKGKKGVLINHWLKCFVFDMVGDVGYSKSYNCLNSGSLHQGILDLEKSLAKAVILWPLPWLVRIINSLPGMSNPMQAPIDFAASNLGEWKVFKRNKGPDILSCVFQGKSDLTYEEEVEDTMMLQIAASNTTLAALTFAMYYLSVNPEVQMALRKEIEANADVTNIASEAIQGLPLLAGVIDETLRMHPSVPSGLPRLTPPEGLQLGGTYIPGKTTVSCPTWTIQRDPKHFSDPNTWNPFRWINPPENHNTKAFFPFSLGPYGCVGKAFAYMEMKQALAKLVTSFDFKIAPGHDENRVIDESKDHTVYSCEPLWLKMETIARD